MLKLLIFRCTRCSETGAHSDHFLLHINTLAISLHDALRSSILWTVSRSCLVSLP